MAVAFLVWGTHMGRAGEPVPDTFWPTGGGLVVWRTADGSLGARTTDAAGTTIDSSLGAGSDARLIAGGSRAVVLVTLPGGGHRLVRYAPGYAHLVDDRGLARPRRADVGRRGRRSLLRARGPR